MLGDAIYLPDATMRCDTPDCAYETKVNPRSVREHIGARCPLCGSIMVTEETAAKAEEGLALIDALNAAIGPVETVERGNGLLISTRIDKAGDVAEVTLRKVTP